jgi:hypothetical protein
MTAWESVVVVVVAGIVFACWQRRDRCPCTVCRGRKFVRASTMFRLRAKAVVSPGWGWPARVRYGLTFDELAMRGQYQMPAGHPEWMTGELRSDCEEWLASLDAELENW